jgi:tetratricopeptide (TPR) repeat protein
MYLQSQTIVKFHSTLRFFLVFSICLLLSAYTNINQERMEQGLSFLQLQDYNSALIEFTNEIKVNPDNASAYNYRGVVKAKQGDFDGSLSDYDMSISLESNKGEAFANRGIARARTGDLEGAIIDFNKAILLEPTNGNSYFNHGMAMEMISDMPSACNDWEKADSLGFKQANIFVRQKCE